MKEVVYNAFTVFEKEGDFERKIIQKRINNLPEDHLLIKVNYSSLNYKDVLSAIGNKGVTREYPHTPGIDAAGIVEKSENDDFKKGDKVIVSGYDLGMNTDGGFAEYIKVPAQWAVPLPNNLSLKESMIYGTAGFAAALSIFKLIESGVNKNNILVTGASGGVGSIACSILSKIGYRVTAATSKINQKDYFGQLGVDEIIDRHNISEETDKMLLKQKWSGVVDTVGGDILANAIKATEYGGTVTCCGNIASPNLNINVYPFILRGISLLGVDTGRCDKIIRSKIWHKLANEWKLKNLNNIAHEIEFKEIDYYIEQILTSKNKGRILIKIN